MIFLILIDCFGWLRNDFVAAYLELMDVPWTSFSRRMSIIILDVIHILIRGAVYFRNLNGVSCFQLVPIGLREYTVSGWIINLMLVHKSWIHELCLYQILLLLLLKCDYDILPSIWPLSCLIIVSFIRSAVYSFLRSTFLLSSFVRPVPTWLVSTAL